MTSKYTQENDNPWEPLWSIPMMRNAIESDDTMLYWALLALYRGQTSEESFTGTTKERNGRGFDMNDAYLGSMWAGRILHGGDLTDEEKHNARSMLRKYGYQLTTIKNNEKGEK